MKVVKPYVLRPSDRLIIVPIVEVFFSEGEVEDAVLHHLDVAAQQMDHALAQKDLALAGEQCRNTVVTLHNLFLSQGNRPELRETYRGDSFKWYTAGCELSILGLAGHQLFLCQVGMTHMFLAHSSRLNFISPIHIFQSELAAGTLEESCLAPFRSRSKQQLAEQLGAPPKLAKQVSNWDEGEFYKSMANARTRVIGYFPHPDHSAVMEPGIYRPEPPIPSIEVTPIAAADQIFVCLPKHDEMLPYNYPKIVDRVKSLSQAEPSFTTTESCTTARQGDLIRLSVNEQGQFSFPTFYLDSEAK